MPCSRPLASGPCGIFRLVLAESLLQTLAGGLLGVGFGVILLAWSEFSVGTEGVTIAFRPSMSLALSGIMVSAVVGLVAGVVPGYLAARTEIVAALRQA